MAFIPLLLIVFDSHVNSVSEHFLSSKKCFYQIKIHVFSIYLENTNISSSLICFVCFLTGRGKKYLCPLAVTTWGRIFSHAWLVKVGLKLNFGSNAIQPSRIYVRHISVSNWVFLTIRPLPYISTKSLIDPPPWYIRMCPIKGGSPDVLTQWERGRGEGERVK